MARLGSHDTFEKNKIYNTSFRDGFNKSTTERFFIIEEVMTQLSLKNVFHIENDNLLYVNLDDLLKVFAAKYAFASVFDNDRRCVPSFVYIRDAKSIGDLNDFINNSPQTNDMDLLSRFRYSNAESITLPILPSFYDKKLASQSGHATNNPNQYFNNFELFDSIFDAACIGQYLGGVDPRNYPNNSVGFINETSLFNPSIFNYYFRDDSRGRKVPVLSFNKREVRINNLHIHSKNLRKFM